KAYHMEEIASEKWVRFVLSGDSFLGTLTLPSVTSRSFVISQGQGSGKKGHFQDKVTNLSQLAEVQALLQDYLSSWSVEE
uniref:Uncharacterized protein n=1 Tax=Vombatus ursinus TaxID=29139 RepID=A0A4X2KDU3_VOMUR